MNNCQTLNTITMKKSLFLAIFCLIFLAACSNQNKSKDVSDEATEVIEEVGDSLDEAGEAMEEVIDETGEAIEDAADEIEGAVEDIQEAAE
ncbi:MAG: hypothetical protein KA807_03465 [Prolixibacteraceae bacterium]|nr:hypothetical protein [Prolixibacteraceae bacterium]